jgi:integrase
MTRSTGTFDLAPVNLDARALDLLVKQMALIGGLSPATLRKYESSLQAFVAWYREQEEGTTYPVPAPIVARYLAYLLVHGRLRRGGGKPRKPRPGAPPAPRVRGSASAIGVDVAALAWLHRQGHADDPTRDPVVRAVIRDIRRRVGVAPEHQRRALSLDELGAMVRQCGDNLVGMRDRALLVVGWFAGLRRSEIIGLDVGDLTWLGSDVAIRIRRSKRDQTGRGRIVGLPLAANPAVCPVRALHAWIEAARDAQNAGGGEGGGEPKATAGHLAVYDGGGEDSTANALFRSVDRWGNVGDRLLPRHVHAIVRDYGAAAVLPGLADLGAHSLRRGLITELRRAGVGLDIIAKHVGHASIGTTAGYVEVVDALDSHNPLRRLFPTP